MDIYLTNNHLPDFSFLSLISESETNVELHPKLKLTNILNFNQKFFFKFHSRQYYRIYILECGPMPNLMVALPNIGGALCSTPQSLADVHY